MGFGSKRLVIGMALGVVLMPHLTDARHVPNTVGETKVHLQQEEAALREDAKGNIRERIQAILHGQTEKSSAKTSRVPSPMVPVDLTNEAILGQAMATPQQCVQYLLSVNPKPALSVSPQELVSYYYEEGAREGIRPDVAFAQALKETGYFRYGGTVTPDQNNYCGLGTTSSTVKGVYFSSAQLGVRAHIQHLLAYASTRQPATPVVDPRYALVRSLYGSNTLNTWRDLNGRWAVPGHTYGQSIMELFSHIVKEP